LKLLRRDGKDFGLGVVAFLLLVMWRVPPWLVVILGAVGATIIASISWLAVSF
jgi:chromate transporter